MGVSKISFTRFKAIVLEEMNYLLDRGYQVFMNEYSVPPQHIQFRKELVEGLVAIIEFQLKQIYAPPLQSFNVRLRRNHVPLESEKDLPVVVTLASLMWLKYKIRIFPDKKYFWEFSSEEELYDELKHARLYLNRYGIKWLEKPSSTINWKEEEKSP